MKMQHLVLLIALAATPATAVADTPEAGPIVSMDAGGTEATGVGPAAPPVAPELAPVAPGELPAPSVGLIERAYNAGKAGNYWVVFAVAVVFATWAVQKAGAKVLPWLATSRGKAITVMTTSLIGALANGWLDGVPWSPVAIYSAIQYAFLAAGVHGLTKAAATPTKAST